MRAQYDLSQMNEHKLAIYETLALYSRAWDAKDAARFARTFTSDGVFELYVGGSSAPVERIVGRQAQLDDANEAFRGRLADRTTRHYQTGVIFDELSAQRAKTSAMLLVTHKLKGMDPKIAVTGVYADDWHNTECGWKLALRRLYLDD